MFGIICILTDADVYVLIVPNYVEINNIDFSQNET